MSNNYLLQIFMNFTAHIGENPRSAQPRSIKKKIFYFEFYERWAKFILSNYAACYGISFN
jgi:hypothetical protein